MYNREGFIARAIESCLRQVFLDFEVIVVDDGSTDLSVERVKRFSDPRIKLICHTVNRGVGPARNTGIGAANGEWIIFFDSDDEFRDDALSVIYDRAIQVGQSIFRMQFMGRVDSGALSPDPPLWNERWDYIAYIKWMERGYGRRQDTMPVIKRVTFKKVKFYDDRTLEGPYHLDFMRQFDAWTFPDVVALYHQDAENQLTKIDGSRSIAFASDQLSSGELVLREHGAVMKSHAPQIYGAHISGLATLCFLSGNIRKGISYSLLSLKINPLSLKRWAILLLGLLGPRPLVLVKTWRTRP